LDEPSHDKPIDIHGDDYLENKMKLT